MLITTQNTPIVGILYDATANNDYCNGHIAQASPTDLCPNLSECLHWDDIKDFLPNLAAVPDTSGKV